MSAAAPAAPQKPRKRWFARGRNRADHEFLAAALEVLETPPSPVRMALIISICALTLAALGWAYFGRFDIVAIAQGKIQPTGRVKVVQPLETGRVRALHVSNGVRVHEGAVLLELDSEEVQSEEQSVTNGLAAFRAETARRRAAAATARTRDFATPAVIAFELDAPIGLRQRETDTLAADLRQLASVLASGEAQGQQKFAERQRLQASVESQRRLIATLQERVTMRSTLVDSQSGTRTNLIDAKAALQQQQSQLANTEGQLAENEASMDVLAREGDKAVRNFISENTQKLGEAERQADDFAQRLVKARARTRHMTLTAPIDGTVQALTVTTVGQVVTTGQDLMRVVPDGGALEIEVYLPNKDIGFVHLDQEAIVKVESFPFTRYGTIDARVSRIATDAIPEPDAAQIEGNSSKALNASIFAGAQRTQNLVFPVTLTPAAVAITADGLTVPLSPGMAVSVEIKTGSRRILEYLFSPLTEVTSQAMHER